MQTRPPVPPFTVETATEKVINQVKILTSPDCGYCHAAKKLLQKHDIDFHEVDLFKENQKAQQLLTQSGQRTVPQIFINEQAIGGYSELSHLINSTEFDVAVLSTN